MPKLFSRDAMTLPRRVKETISFLIIVVLLRCESYCYISDCIVIKRQCRPPPTLYMHATKQSCWHVHGSFSDGA